MNEHPEHLTRNKDINFDLLDEKCSFNMDDLIQILEKCPPCSSLQALRFNLEIKNFSDWRILSTISTCLPKISTSLETFELAIVFNHHSIEDLTSIETKLQDLANALQTQKLLKNLIFKLSPQFSSTPDLQDCLSAGHLITHFFIYIPKEVKKNILALALDLENVKFVENDIELMNSLSDFDSLTEFYFLNANYFTMNLQRQLGEWVRNDQTIRKITGTFDHSVEIDLNFIIDLLKNKKLQNISLSDLILSDIDPFFSDSPTSRKRKTSDTPMIEDTPLKKIRIFDWSTIVSSIASVTQNRAGEKIRQIKQLIQSEDSSLECLELSSVAQNEVDLDLSDLSRVTISKPEEWRAPALYFFEDEIKNTYGHDITYQIGLAYLAFLYQTQNFSTLETYLSETDDLMGTTQLILEDKRTRFYFNPLQMAIILFDIVNNVDQQLSFIQSLINKEAALNFDQTQALECQTDFERLKRKICDNVQVHDKLSEYHDDLHALYRKLAQADNAMSLAMIIHGNRAPRLIAFLAKNTNNLADLAEASLQWFSFSFENHLFYGFSSDHPTSLYCDNDTYRAVELKILREKTETLQKQDENMSSILTSSAKTSLLFFPRESRISDSIVEETLNIFSHLINQCQELNCDEIQKLMKKLIKNSIAYIENKEFTKALNCTKSAQFIYTLIENPTVIDHLFMMETFKIRVQCFINLSNSPATHTEYSIGQDFINVILNVVLSCPMHKHKITNSEEYKYIFQLKSPSSNLGSTPVSAERLSYGSPRTPTLFPVRRNLIDDFDAADDEKTELDEADQRFRSAAMRTPSSTRSGKT